jgi:glycosyltransferase involved in cell wall biosynthesis
MEVSVIIPTYQGRLKLPVVLEALKKQTFRAFELVVVVDGSTDDSVGFLKSDSFVSKIVVQENHGRAHVRNTGVKAAKGELLIFFDDDMEPEAESIARHVNFHSEQANSICGGNQLEFVQPNKSDIQQYKEWISKKWMEKYHPGVQKLTYSNMFFTGANCSMTRASWEKLNGFNEALTDAEDYDFACRALQSGIDVYFDKDNHAYHHDPITWSSYINRLRQYKRAHQKLAASSLISDKKNGYGFKNLVYRLMGHSAVPAWLEKSLLIKMLPRAIRYRLYNIVLHAQGLKV